MGKIQEFYRWIYNLNWKSVSMPGGKSIHDLSGTNCWINQTSLRMRFRSRLSCQTKLSQAKLSPDRWGNHLMMKLGVKHNEGIIKHRSQGSIGKDQTVSFRICYYGHWTCLIAYRWRGLQQSFRLSRDANRAQQCPVISKSAAAGKSRITVTLAGKSPGLPVLSDLD